METVYLKDGGKFDPKKYAGLKGFDVIGETGQEGLEGVTDVLNPSQRGDVRLVLRDRNTGETKKWDVYDFLNRKGKEADVEKTFEEEKKIVQARNEVAERKEIENKMRDMEKRFGVDFTAADTFLPKAKEGRTEEQRREFFTQMLFPTSTKLQERGRYEEKMGGWFPKKYGSAAMDVASLVVRYPVALYENLFFKASKGKYGQPLATSMAGVAEYGADESKTKPGEQESLAEHFQVLQEAFRYDPLRVSKELARESVRDPLSGVALVASLASGGASAPMAGTRTGMLLAGMGAKFKKVYGVKKVSELTAKTKLASGLKRTNAVVKKVNQKIEAMNPVARTLTKTGLEVTAEGGIGAAQGYLGKIFQGGDATYRDAVIEGIEEGAFGLIMSSFYGVKRAVWEKMSPTQKSSFIDTKRDEVKAVEEKLAGGTDASSLSLEEARLIPLTKYGQGNQQVGQDPVGPKPVKIGPNGETLVNRDGDISQVPITEPLPPDVDRNDVQKKRENPAHIDKGTKNLEITEKAERVENSKNLKEMKKQQSLFDSEVNKNVESIIDEAVQEVDAVETEAEAKVKESQKSMSDGAKKALDPQEEIEFDNFKETVGQGLSPQEQAASFANYKVQKERAVRYIKEVKSEKEARNKAREDLIKKGKKSKGSILKTSSDQVINKVTSSNFAKVEADLLRKGKPASDSDVRGAIKKGYKIKGDFKKIRKSGQSIDDAVQSKAYRREALSSQMVADPKKEFYTEGIAAENAPEEFTTHGEFYKKVRTTEPGVIRYKDVNDGYYDFQEEDVIYMDPQHLEPIQPSAARDFEEEDIEFAERMAPDIASIMNRGIPVDAMTGESAPPTGKEIKAVREIAEEVNGEKVHPENLGRSSESAFLESDKSQAVKLSNEVQKKVSIFTPTIEAILRKKKPSEGELNAVAIAEFLHEKRVEIDEKLAKRASVREKLKSLNNRQNAIIERLSRVGENRAEKLEKHSEEYKEWDNNPEIMTPPPKAPNTTKEEAASEKAYLDLESVNQKIHETEMSLEEFDGLDELDFANQQAYEILQKAGRNNFKSFKDGTIGSEPKKHSGNVSSKKWKERLKKIDDWKIKESAINQMMAASFPALYQSSPELADMAAKMAWKNKIPNTLKEAKNKAHMWMEGQSGHINTAVFREMAKFGAFSAASGGPVGGLVMHIGYNFLMPKFKSVYNSALGKYTVQSIRSQIATRKAFQRAIPRINQAFLVKNRMVNSYMSRFDKAAKGVSDAELVQARNYIEGRVKDVPPKVAKAAEKMRSIFLDIGKEARNAGFKFDSDPNFFTRVFNWEAVQEMKSDTDEGKALFENEVQNLMENEGMDRGEAAATLVSFYDNSEEMQSAKSKKQRKLFYEACLEKSGKNPKAFHFLVTRQKAKMTENVIGSLSYKRTAPRLTDAMYVSNVKSVMESYIHGVSQAVTYRNKFGKGLQVINDALMAEFGKTTTSSKKGGGTVTRKTGELTEEGEVFKSYIDAELFNKSLIMKWGADPETFSAKVAAGFTRYQFWSKLMTSIISPVRNMVTAGIVSNSLHGVSANAMGLLRTFGQLVSGHPFRSAHLAGAITDMTMTQSVGAEMMTPSKLEEAVLGKHPFTISEKFVRAFGYNTGIVAAKRLFSTALAGGKRGVDAAKKMTDIIGEELAAKDIAAGKLSAESMELMAAQVASDVGGHARPMNLSPFLSTAEGKLIGQYRRIAFHQSVVFKDKILVPASNWNILPLLRWGAMVGLSTPAVVALSSMIYGERDEKNMSLPGQQAWGLMKYINQTNALALFGDLAASIEHGTGFGETPVVGTFTGPTISTFLNAATDITSIATQGRSADEVVKELVRKEFPGAAQASEIFELDFLQK